MIYVITRSLLLVCCLSGVLHLCAAQEYETKAPRHNTHFASPALEVLAIPGVAPAPLNDLQPTAQTLNMLEVTGNLVVGGQIINQTINITDIISSALLVSATSANQPNTVALRDAQGSFSAGKVTATNGLFTGLVSVASAGNVYVDAQGNLYHGASGGGGSGSGTSNNVPNTLVLRAPQGNFAAGTITAQLIGNVTGAASDNVLTAGDTMIGVLYADGGIDVTESGSSDTLNMGITNADIINVGTGTSTHTINIGTGTGLETVNIGTGSGATTIALGGVNSVVNISGTLAEVTTPILSLTDKLLTLNASGGVATGFNTGIQVAEAGTVDGYIVTNGTRNAWLMQAPASNAVITFSPTAMSVTLGVLHADTSGSITDSPIVDADIAGNAAIADTKLATIITAGKVANSATTAIAQHVPDAIVTRNAQGSFAAGTITADSFVGTLTGNASGLIGSLSGDVAGTQAATTVALVGGQAAANVAAATTLASGATSANAVGAQAIIRRDPQGGFSAGTITATNGVLTGLSSVASSGNVYIDAQGNLYTGTSGGGGSVSGTSNNVPNTLVLRNAQGSFSAGTITANNFVGTLAGNASGFVGALGGDVTGTQAATTVALVGGQAAANVAAATTLALGATSANAVGAQAIVRRDPQGGFSAGTITATNGVLTGLSTVSNSGNVYIDDQGNFYRGTSGGGSVSGTSNNVPDTLVLRDAQGGFSAGTITADSFEGTLSGTASGFTGNLAGDVTGAQSSTTVAFVGGQAAANVASSTTLVLAATSTNSSDTLVRRDARKSFAAGTITADFFVGTLLGTTQNFSGTFGGNVTGTQLATVVSTVGGQSAANVAAGTALANNATSTNIAGSQALVSRDPQGGFAAGTITANNVVISGLSSVGLPGNLYIDSAGNFYGGTSSAAIAPGTSSNIPNTLVMRDGLGNFAVGTMSASNMILTGLPSIASFSNVFVDVDGTIKLSTAPLSSSNSIPNTLVSRDNQASFLAGTITAARLVASTRGIQVNAGDVTVLGGNAAIGNMGVSLGVTAVANRLSVTGNLLSKIVGDGTTSSLVVIGNGSSSPLQLINTLSAFSSSNVLALDDASNVVTVVSTSGLTPNSLVSRDGRNSFQAGTVTADVLNLKQLRITAVAGQAAARFIGDSATSAVVITSAGAQSPLQLNNMQTASNTTYLAVSNGQVISGAATSASIGNTVMNRDANASYSATTESILGSKLSSTLGIVPGIHFFLGTGYGYQGRYIYTGGGGLVPSVTMSEFDISNPAAPAFITSLTNSGEANPCFQIQIGGKYAYGMQGLFLNTVDISDTKPLAFTSYSISASSIAISSGYVFVGDSNTIKTLDVTDPTNPVVVGSLSLPATSSINSDSFYIQDRYLYFSVGDNTLGPSFKVVDISNPLSLSTVGTLALGATASGTVVVCGRYAYVNASGLVIIDVSNPTSPVVAGSLAGVASPFFIQGNTLYASGSHSVAVVDVSVPTAPVLRTTLSLGASYNLYALNGRYVIANQSGDGSFETFDVGGAYIQQVEAGTVESTSTSNRGLLRTAALGVSGSAWFGQGFDATNNAAIAGQLQVTASSSFIQPVFSITGNAATAACVVSSAGAQNPLRLLNIPSTASGANLFIDADGYVWQGVSSRRYKEDIRPLPVAQAEAIIDQLEPVIFSPAPQVSGNHDQYGFIAEAVAVVAPQMVHHDHAGRVESIDYTQMHALELSAVQALRADIQQLRTDCKQMRAEAQRSLT